MTVRLQWHWPTDVRPYAQDLAGMLAASVEDEGILGYAAAPTRADLDGFVGGLERMLSDGGGHVLIGEDTEGVVAMCVMKTSSMPNCAHLADVAKAYLVPRVRGTPAVYELAAQVCAGATELGVELLTIDVREDSRAHKVWSRLGFTTYGVLDDYARVDGRSCSGHFMRRPVAELAALVEGRLHELRHRRQAAGRASDG